MVDPKEAAKLIRQHFDELTTEQFMENLHRSCPEIFEVTEQLALPLGEGSSHQQNLSDPSPEVKSQI